jgi:hypothetical protein
MTINDAIIDADMAAKKTKAKRRGRRPGAGRKGFIVGARRLSVDYPGAHMAALEEIAEERGTSVASVVREAVRAYLEREGRI